MSIFQTKRVGSGASYWTQVAKQVLKELRETPTQVITDEEMKRRAEESAKLNEGRVRASSIEVAV